MPRFKTAPLRKSSHHRQADSSELDQSVLNDEEVRRLEEELDVLRREKAKQIRKMQVKREEVGRVCHDSPCSSSEFDTNQYSDDDDLNQSATNTRQSTRDLADGFQKAQQRFMFNVQNIEAKYRERERSGIPESKVEVDRYGNFFFPESMSGARQQSFVNRMYQADALFGKGSVSAPRNSIQSFEGDNRALEKSLKLDRKFGNELKMSEFPFNKRREEKIFSSAYVSGIPKRKHMPSSISNWTSSRYTEDLDDDVFEGISDHRKPYRQFRAGYDRHPTTSTLSSTSNAVMSDTEEEELADDEENSDDSDESFSDDEDEDDNEELQTTPIALKLLNSLNSQSTHKTSASRGDSTTERETKPVENTAKSVQKIETYSKVVMNEHVKPNSSQDMEYRPEIYPSKTPETIKNESTRMSIKKEKSSNTLIKTPISSSFNAHKSDLPQRPNSAQKLPGKSITSAVDDVIEPHKLKNETPITPRKSCTTSFAEKIIGNATKAESKESMVKFSDDSNEENVNNDAKANLEEKLLLKPKVSPVTLEEPAIPSSVRPNRTKRPTEKFKASMLPGHNHEHSTEAAIADSRKCGANSKKRSSEKSPFCKHCEYIKEEKRKLKASGLLKKDIASQEAQSSNADNAVLSFSNSHAVNALEVAENKNSERKGRRSKKGLSKEQQVPQGNTKRRSGTESTEEPEKKKQKLIDSDLLSIPSSMTIIVDTELIAAENKQLSLFDIPQFSENSPSSSVWSTTVDVQWIKDVTKVQGERKNRRFFGVPVTEYPKDVPIINFWVNNLLCEDSRKDPFTTDYRRILAQDKKARIDVKAGYDVRF